MKVRVISQQNLIDFTVQELGSAAGLFDVIAANEGFSVDTVLQAGDEVEVPENILDINVVNTYKKNKLQVVTGEDFVFGDFSNGFSNGFKI